MVLTVTHAPSAANTATHASNTAPAPSTHPEVKFWQLRSVQAHTRQSWQLILIILATLGLISRLLRLSYPTDASTPIFDEKHYVPQSWQILRSWDNPLIGGIEDNPAYGLVVHPPLAKQIEALGMALFGYTPFGWRVMSALASVAVLLIIADIARRISRSQTVGLFAGIIALSDGIMFVTGRSAMLDVFQALFVIGAAYLLLLDHEQMERRFTRVRAESRILDHPFGPRMGFRWWRFAAGICLGLALSVKWSGLYYMAFAGLTVVAVDWARRRRYGVTAPLRGTLLFDAIPHFLSLVVVPVMVYLFSFRAWFASETSVFRHAAESGEYSETQDWALSFLPDWLENFIFYHYSVLRFHTELTNSNGHHHSWESKPWSWLASTRSLMYYNPDLEGSRQTVLLIGTPAIWWFCVPVLLWGLWSLIIRRESAWALPLVGFTAGFLPWLLNLDRQMYLFYALNLAPFLVIMLALALGQLLAGQASALSTPDRTEMSHPEERIRALITRTWWAAHWPRVLVIGYLTLVIWNFLYFLPLYTGMPLSEEAFQQRMWLPSWH